MPCTCENALSVPWTGAVVIANPPYNAAEMWARKAVTEADAAVFLTRLNLFGGQARAEFWRAFPPDFVGVLSKRPSFAFGKTDATEYAWIGWRTGASFDGARLAWLLPDKADRRPATQMDLLAEAAQ